MHRSGNYGEKCKENIGFEDVFTIADITIQKTIEYNLKELYPYITIVGEEDAVNIKDIVPTLQPDQLHKNIVT